MKILKRSPQIINNILSIQQDFNVEYRLMKYIITKQINDVLLIYNTLTLELIELDKEETKAFISGKYNQLDYLIKHWYLVKKDFDDFALYKNLLQVYSLVTQNDYLDNFTILTTTDCNAHCFYCFENGCDRYTMTEKTAIDVANYICEVADRNIINIKWFGGEPLKNTLAINLITSLLRKKGINFTSSIVTNGYLFDKKNVEDAKKLWNLEKAQITLDGTEEVYNRIKAYNNGDLNAFKTVIENIDNLINNQIKVVIRLNLNEKNNDDLINLIDYLFERFGNKIEIYTALIYNKRGINYNTENKDKQLAMITQQTILDNYIFSKGMATKLKKRNALKINACMADSNNSIVILPDGSLGKCDYYITKNNEYLIGDIYKGFINNDISNAFKKRAFFEDRCTNCAILPLCFKLKNCPTSNSEYCDEEIKNYKINYYRQRLESLI